jgi:hypothetical protein
MAAHKQPRKGHSKSASLWSSNPNFLAIPSLCTVYETPVVHSESREEFGARLCQSKAPVSKGGPSIHLQSRQLAEAQVIRAIILVNTNI